MKKQFIILLLAFGLYANANVQMPLLFDNGMVLQRDKPIPVWGWADAHEKVEIRFHGQTIRTKADKNGKWSVHMKPEIAGGPYTLSIKGKNTIVLTDVLVGEVWLCSGQSNMEFTVARAMDAKKEINDADFPMIRQFLVEKDVASTPQSNLKGGHWDVCNSNTVGDFTAVGYFFAKKLYAELKIPIGIINSSWGGTCVETWISREAFQNSGEFKDMIADMPNVDMDLLMASKMQSLKDKVQELQGASVDRINETSYMEPTFNDTGWPEMNAPELWENQQLSGLDGTVWMRKSVLLSPEDAQHGALLELAQIDDQDVTYINGIEVGTTDGYDVSRTYEIPAEVLKEEQNTIAIRITDRTGGGGIWGDPSNLKLTLKNSTVPLSGPWKFNVVDIKSSISPNTYPSLLFDAMINPLIPYAFQGVLWYQGESNVSRAEQYTKAFPLLINDWRKKWDQGDFPFYFVQLSSFDEFKGNSNSGSTWAELREAQTKTLEVAHTGMCVTTDIGNAKDIHPKNKQDVGLRLAAIALHNVYQKDVVFQGPTYKGMAVKDQHIILSFDTNGSGLMTPDKYGYLKGFEVAGPDRVFHYAKAYIKDDKVIVSSEAVLNPVAVRYGWADDAGEGNLYNKEKFPAAPFRTDTWDLTTKGVKYTFDQ